MTTKPGTLFEVFGYPLGEKKYFLYIETKKVHFGYHHFFLTLKGEIKSLWSDWADPNNFHNFKKISVWKILK